MTRILPKPLQKHHLHITLPIVGLCLAITAAVTVYYGSAQPKDASAQPNPAVIVYSTDTPSTDKPSKNYVWQGTITNPKRLFIPKLRLDAYVQNVGIDQNKQIAAPNNSHFVGWFVDSARPGQTGLSIMNGRAAAQGVFADLHKLAVGDAFQIELGSGKLQAYQVTNVQTVSAAQSAQAAYTRDAAIPYQLNLISWASPSEPGEQLVVSTELISEP